MLSSAVELVRFSSIGCCEGGPWFIIGAPLDKPADCVLPPMGCGVLLGIPGLPTFDYAAICCWFCGWLPAGMLRPRYGACWARMFIFA